MARRRWGLDAVAALPSVRTAAGDAPPHLYLFEQVTRLDSLVLDSSSAPKRNRTRHQGISGATGTPPHALQFKFISVHPPVQKL